MPLVYHAGPELEEEVKGKGSLLEFKETESEVRFGFIYFGLFNNLKIFPLLLYLFVYLVILG
jgi:hypothetical protein